MKVQKITFTGIKDLYDLNDNALNSEVEFGILVHDKYTKSGDKPRYPSFYMINKIIRYAADQHNIKLALHLCGSYYENFINRDRSTNVDLINILRSPWIDRIQLNVADRELTQEQVNGIDDCCRYFNAFKDVIIQVSNQKNLDVTTRDQNILIDASCGKGVVTKEWLIPKYQNTWSRISFAGGFSPENLKEQLTSIKNAYNGSAFINIDMESKIRSPDDSRIDKEKCWQIINIVDKFNQGIN